jgi:hypothetical protein
MQSKSLTDLCINTIAEQIYIAPPMIQEMIIGQSTDIIAKKVQKEVKQEFINEIKVLKSIVPSISKSIIINRASFFNDSIDYYKVYKHIQPDIVKLAIDIAENTVSEMNNSFSILTTVSSRRHNFYTDEDEQQEENSEEESYRYDNENSSENE